MTPEELIKLVKDVTKDVEFPQEIPYEPKYTHFNYSGDKKLLILVSGWLEAGKTKFSNRLKKIIDSADLFDVAQNEYLKTIYKDSRQIDLEDPIFWQSLKSKERVTICSASRADKVLDNEEVKSAIGNANVINVCIKPTYVEKMQLHAKDEEVKKASFSTVNNSNSLFESYYNDDNQNYITITNNYTENSILEGCDKVIDEICRLLGTQDVSKKTPERPDAAKFSQSVGSKRINEGNARVKAARLLQGEHVEETGIPTMVEEEEVLE